MLFVKFSSTYTERDRFGNIRSQQNSLEATGTYREVNKFVGNIMNNAMLPGINQNLNLNYEQTNNHYNPIIDWKNK